LFSLSFISSAQDLTGIWRGYFITEGGQQYKLEFQVEQNKTLTVTGVSYSYLQTRFYGKATMTGKYNKTEGKFSIQELRTTEVRSLGGGGTCLMNYSFNYSKSGKEEFLEGSYLGKSEDRKNPKNNGEWGDCGEGTVYLHKVSTSDFYVESFLRDKPRPKETTTNAPPVKNPTVKNNSTVTRTTTQKTNTGTKTTVKNNNPVTRTTTAKTDTAKRIITQPEIKNPNSEKKVVITPAILKTRENSLAQAITVNTDSILIKLYDNGEIDGDSISVFVDNRLMLSHKMLSTVPIILPLKFDETGAIHEVVMVAENLGRIPPNTSLMIIYAGDKRYQVQITSTEQKNAMVRFKYVKPGSP
jgi:hypothetical protein